MIITVVHGREARHVQSIAGALAKAKNVAVLTTENRKIVSELHDWPHDEAVIADLSGMLSLDIWFFKASMNKTVTVLYVEASGGYKIPHDNNY